METALTLMETPRPFYTQFFSLSLYPGTALSDRALAEGLIEGNEYQTKDYFRYRKCDSNNLVRIAAFLPRRWMKFIVELYRKNPASRWCKTNLITATIFSIAIAEPLACVKTVWLSQRKSLVRTLRVLPNYLGEGLSRLRRQFG